MDLQKNEVKVGPFFDPAYTCHIYLQSTLHV